MNAEPGGARKRKSRNHILPGAWPFSLQRRKREKYSGGADRKGPCSVYPARLPGSALKQPGERHRH